MIFVCAAYSRSNLNVPSFPFTATFDLQAYRMQTAVDTLLYSLKCVKFELYLFTVMAHCIQIFKSRVLDNIWLLL